MFRKPHNHPCYIDAKSEQASFQITNAFEYYISHINFFWKELVFLCIGSDRITGDCLGPLIGYQLSRTSIPTYHVYGTLRQPVHALNLSEILHDIQYSHPHALTIAIDASLGSPSHQGCICVGNGSIYPGAGVCKKLPAVGDIYITGIVNQTGLDPHLLLSNTRLADVMHMADIISYGILQSRTVKSYRPAHCQHKKGQVLSYLP